MYKGTKGLDQNHDWLSRVFTTKTLKNIYVMNTKIQYSDKKREITVPAQVLHTSFVPRSGKKHLPLRMQQSGDDEV